MMGIQTDVTLGYNFAIENSYIINVGTDSNNINMYALECQLPGLGIQTSKVGSYKNTISHIIKGQKIDYENLSIPFILDEKWEVYRYFYDYIKNRYLNEHTKVNTELDDSFTLTIYITDSKKNIMFAIKYYNTIIKNVTNVNRTSNLTDISYPTITVEFEYSYYEIVDI